MKIFVLNIFYISPVIDSITGYFMGITGEDNAISKIYRMTVFVILYIFYFMTSEIKKASYQVLLSIYSVLLMFYYWIQGGILWVDSSYIIKLFYPIVLIAVSKILYNKQQLGIIQINKIIDYYSLIYPLTIMSSALLGIGHSAYRGNIANGYMGLFSGGNEISVVLAILFMIDLHRLYTLKENKKIIVEVILLGFALLMTQTKTGYIIAASILILFVVKKIKESPQKVHRNITLVIMIMVLLVIYIHIQHDQIKIMIDRLIFKYHQLNNSFLNMLFSNRQNKIIPIMKENYTFSVKGIQNILFGNGFCLQVLEKNNNTFGLVEMDLFDVLFQNGVIMLCIVIRFYWKIVKQGIKSKDIFILFVYIMALLYSALAGHVLYNPLSSTTFALLCIYVYANRSPFLNKTRKYYIKRQNKQ